MSSPDEHVRRRPRYVPDSTYRLQIHRDFPLTDATAIVPYLSRLGVGACYTSPYFTAAPGSTHGYDVADHNEINPEVGGAEAHAAFTAALARFEMGHVVDFVPNHMGIGTGNNARWNDLLENGPSSPAAIFFDVDWRPVKAELRRKLLLPILGDQYGRVLERGELQLAFADGRLSLTYFETELPINPRQAPRVYGIDLPALADELGAEHPDVLELESIITALQKIPSYTDTSAQSVAERHRESVIAEGRLRALAGRSPRIQQHIEHAVRQLNG